MNHTMSDGAGLVQFLTAIAELACGASKPSVLPVWRRDLLCSRNPPRVSCTHREYEVTGPPFPLQHSYKLGIGRSIFIERSFFFGSDDLTYLRQRLQPHLKCGTTFEFLSAFLWKCRTVALRLDPCQEVHCICVASVWPKLKPQLPIGYYGNAFVFRAAVCTAGDLTRNDTDYAVGLIKKAKAEAIEEYVRSVIDFMATHGRPQMAVTLGRWLVSDNTHIRYQDVDFGWGKPVYGGITTANVGGLPGFSGAFVKGVNGKGEGGIFVMVCLPALAMERFAAELHCAMGNSTLTHTYSKI